MRRAAMMVGPLGNSKHRLGALDRRENFLQESQGITQTEAYQAASMAADLRITQLVDGNVGVHMMISKSYLRPRR